VRFEVTHVSHQAGDLGARNVGGVGDDEVEAPSCWHGVEQVALCEVDIVGGSEAHGILASDGKSSVREISPHDVPRPAPEAEGECDAPRPGTQVERTAVHVARVRSLERHFHEDLTIRSRHEDAPIDRQLEAEKLPLAQEIRHRLTRAASHEKRLETREFGGAERAIVLNDQLHAAETKRFSKQQLCIEPRRFYPASGEIGCSPSEHTRDRPSLVGADSTIALWVIHVLRLRTDLI
jgi:hypothetical protein